MSQLTEQTEAVPEPSSTIVSFARAQADRPQRAEHEASTGPTYTGHIIQGRFGADVRPGIDAPAKQHGHDGDDGQLSELSRAPRVLVVDHDTARCSELGELFGDIGYEAYESSNPERAEGWWSDLKEVDVVLLDLNLPERGAFDLLDKLLNRADKDHRYSPAVIVLARRDQRALALEAMYEGAFDWQETPIDIAMLSHAMARATEHVRLRRVDRLFQDLMNNSL